MIIFINKFDIKKQERINEIFCYLKAKHHIKYRGGGVYATRIGYY